MVYFITWEMHEFPHIENTWVFSSISHSMGKGSKTHLMGQAWDIGSHTFSIVRLLFPVRFPFCGKLHHIGNACVFSSISHSMRKGSKTPQIWRVWEIGFHTFSIAWVLFSVRFPSCGIHHCMGNAWVSPSISQSTRKSN